MRLRQHKQAFTGFGTVGNMILVMIMLAVILFIIYSVFYEKIIKGSLGDVTDKVDKDVKDLGTEQDKFFNTGSGTTAEGNDATPGGG